LLENHIALGHHITFKNELHRRRSYSKIALTWSDGQCPYLNEYCKGKLIKVFISEVFSKLVSLRIN